MIFLRPSGAVFFFFIAVYLTLTVQLCFLKTQQRRIDLSSVNTPLGIIGMIDDFSQRNSFLEDCFVKISLK